MENSESEAPLPWWVIASYWGGQLSMVGMFSGFGYGFCPNAPIVGMTAGFVGSLLLLISFHIRNGNTEDTHAKKR